MFKWTSKIFSWFKKIPVFFLIVFLIYNVNLREISSGDTLPARYIPLSILNEFNLDLDEFPGIYKTKTNSNYLYIQHSGGHWLSSYPVLPGILAVPVYAPVVISGIDLDGELINMLSKLASAAIVSLSAVFMFMTLNLLIHEDKAFLISLLYAFSTSNWSIASQGLWQHGPVELFLSVALYFLVKGTKEEKYFIFASPFLALAVATRMPAAVIAVIVYIYILLNHRKDAVKFALPAAAIAGLLFAYNLYYFDNLTGGNAGLESRMIELKPIASIWTANFIPGLFGLLLSPSRGLFIFSPFLIFSIAGIYYIFKKGTEPLYKYLSASAAAYILIFSFYRSWWGGHTYGYRYLLDIIPLLCLFLAFSIDMIINSKNLKYLFAFLVLFSVFVQIIGFLNYPSTWNSTPQDIDSHPERVWDIQDNQIIRCLRNGGRLPEFLKND